MASLTHQPAGLNALHLFYKKRTVIYVEGPEDIPFWNIVFQKCGLTDFVVLSAGGCSALDKVAAYVVESNAGVIIARDSDYSYILGRQTAHARIIYTYGYSIENSMYCARSIAQAAAHYCQVTDDLEPVARIWMAEFAGRFRTLLCYELANGKSGKGVRVMGDNCDRFLTTQSSAMPCETRIEQFQVSISGNFAYEEIEQASDILGKSGRELWHAIRGHFLTNGVIAFIKTQIRKTRKQAIPISKDSLSPLFLSLYSTWCSDGTDFRFMREQIDRIKE